MDSYDHLMTLLVNQVEADKNYGISEENGPLKVRIPKKVETKMEVNNNWYK